MPRKGDRARGLKNLAKAHSPAAKAKHAATRRKTQLVKQAEFLAMFAEIGVIKHVGKALGTVRPQHYEWMRTDPTYPERFKQAQEEFADSLKAEATRRGRDGVRKLKFHQGKPIIDPETKQPYFEHEYSDTLLLAQLKAQCPDEYAERKQIKHEIPAPAISFAVGPGEPNEAFHALMLALKKMHIEQITVQDATPETIAERAAAIKAKRVSVQTVTVEMGEIAPQPPKPDSPALSDSTNG